MYFLFFIKKYLHYTYLSCNCNSFSKFELSNDITLSAPKAFNTGIAFGVHIVSTYPPHNLTS